MQVGGARRQQPEVSLTLRGGWGSLSCGGSSKVPPFENGSPEDPGSAFAPEHVAARHRVSCGANRRNQRRRDELSGPENNNSAGGGGQRGCKEAAPGGM